MFSLPIIPKKVRLLICYNKFKTANLIISNNSSPSTELLDKTNVVYIYSNVPWETVSSKKIVSMLVLPVQLFQDALRCTLLILAPLPYILKPFLFPNPNFEKLY